MGNGLAKTINTRRGRVASKVAPSLLLRTLSALLRICQFELGLGELDEQPKIETSYSTSSAKYDDNGLYNENAPGDVDRTWRFTS